MRCYVNLGKEFSHNPSGSRKVWQTDGVRTYCCSLYPAYYIWEKNTKYNDYNGYSGYASCKDVEMIE